MRQIIYLTLALIGIAMLGRFFTELVHPHIYYFIGFAFLTAIGAHYIGVLGFTASADIAHLYFMGSMMLRLFVTLIAILIYVWYAQQTKAALLLGTFNYFFIYIVYAQAEVRNFLSNLQANS